MIKKDEERRGSERREGEVEGEEGKGRRARGGREYGDKGRGCRLTLRAC